jgi:hypothetical protein
VRSKQKFGVIAQRLRQAPQALGLAADAQELLEFLGGDIRRKVSAVSSRRRSAAPFKFKRSLQSFERSLSAAAWAHGRTHTRSKAKPPRRAR